MSIPGNPDFQRWFFIARCGKPEQHNPNPFLRSRDAGILRYRFLKGDSPSAKRYLAFLRPCALEIYDLSGMEGWLRDAFTKQMGWRPSMSKRRPGTIRRLLRRVRIMSLRLNFPDNSLEG